MKTYKELYITYSIIVTLFIFGTHSRSMQAMERTYPAIAGATAGVLISLPTFLVHDTYKLFHDEQNRAYSAIDTLKSSTFVTSGLLSLIAVSPRELSTLDYVTAGCALFCSSYITFSKLHTMENNRLERLHHSAQELNECFRRLEETKRQLQALGVGVLQPPHDQSSKA